MKIALFLVYIILWAAFGMLAKFFIKKNDNITFMAIWIVMTQAMPVIAYLLFKVF